MVAGLAGQARRVQLIDAGPQASLKATCGVDGAEANLAGDVGHGTPGASLIARGYPLGARVAQVGLIDVWYRWLLLKRASASESH